MRSSQLLDAVRLGNAVAYVPVSLADQHRSADLVFVPVSDLSPSEVVAAWPDTSRSRAIAGFPGDSFTVPEEPVSTLLLPISAPWLKAAEMIDYFRTVAPARGYAIHDAILNANGLGLMTRMMSIAAAPSGAPVARLEPGTSLELLPADSVAVPGASSPIFLSYLARWLSVAEARHYPPTRAVSRSRGRAPPSVRTPLVYFAIVFRGAWCQCEL